jgi:hypothetical protein
MDETVRQRIDEIMGGMDCPKHFMCVEGGFEHICKAEDIDLDDHLVCLDEHPGRCVFALPFGLAHFCRCPLRVYIARNVGA